MSNKIVDIQEKVKAKIEEELAKYQSTEEKITTVTQQHITKNHIIVTNRYLNNISDEAIIALISVNDPPSVFVRSRALVKICTDEKENPHIIILNEPQLRGILARCAAFNRVDHQGREVPTSPPIDIVKDILAMGELPFPPLEGIVQGPVLRPDGTVLTEPGYDPLTKLYYIKPHDLVVPLIPENPTRREVQEARGYLNEMICDFPFQEASDRANALGLCITPPLRPVIIGNVPMATVSARGPGTGKGLLIIGIYLLGTGRVAPMAGLPVAEDEVRKFITSRLIMGDPIIAFDNLEEDLESPTLCRALTAPEWEDRLLGHNRIVRLPQRAVWIANGNNLKLKGDLPRRCFPIQLDAKMARPWERTEFRHGNLQEWILQNRGNLLAAILTIARAWFAAGRPEPKKAVPVMGGFEGWTNTIGGILCFSGIEGFLENLHQFHGEVDLETPEWEAFLSIWGEVIGDSPTTCQKVEVIIRGNSDFAATLPGELGDVLKDPKKSFAKTLGKALAKKEKRPYGEKNLALQKAGTEKHAILWKVAPLKR
jgi:hypothetical protein